MRASVLLLACLAACLAASASATHICDSSFARTYQPNAAGTAYPRQPAITALAPRVLQRGLASQGCTLLSADLYEACANPRPASKPTRFIGTLAFSATVRARCIGERYPQTFLVLAEVQVAAPQTFKTLDMVIEPITRH